LSFRLISGDQVNGFSTFIAILGIVMLEKRMHQQMQPHLAIAKLWSFKTVAGLDALQVVIFPTLAAHRVWTPSWPYYVSYNDFALALPNFLLVWELVFVSAAFLWSFNFNRYRDHVLHNAEVPAKGVGGALLDVFKINDI
jgi:hypothetical protein